ncbi:YlbF family regulator [Caldalkalibacillus mannanilyticus]|uniref:YlbF family regulator n=1 Tax=Caldalkalibacillus mannanilyticus TaxID=1418 RepID=UPI000468FA0B|nr:YlbF family regulator [Caldalkalibacillus mannanilyticus]
MIASLDLSLYLEEAYQLGQLILESEEVKEYRLTRKRMDEDPEAQSLIQAFLQKKEAFEEAERFGKYHPDYQRLNREMREVKRLLDMNELVARFKKAEKEMESILNEISKVVAFAVSEEIKVPSGNPFWDAIGCGSGGGCGCKSGGGGCG